MIATHSKGLENQGGEMLFQAFGLGAFVAALTLLTAVPMHADTFYSGAAVNSNGSVYSWGVTSACSMSSHTTHMTSTLTSPKGRQASGNASDGCYTEVDLYLAFDPTDTGTYETESDSWAFCPVLGLWFWNGVESEGSANDCPVPTNLTIDSGSDAGGGVLHFQYSYSSSIGDVSNLTSCTLNEKVDYPGGNPYSWPNPWTTATINPTIGPNPPVPGTAGSFTDDQQPGTIKPPYVAANFTATQNYRYSCSCTNGGNPVVLSGPISIVRSVIKRTDGKYKYTVTKSGYSAKIDPLP
jgi:hypothetical protein